MVRFLDQNNVENILNQKNSIINLLNSNKKLQKLIIQKSGKDLVTPLCVIVLNILKGVLKLSEAELSSLKKFKIPCRNLVKKSSLKSKKVLLQKGGFLNILLPIVFTALGFLKNEIF